MKKIFLILIFLYSSIFGAPPFTAENINNLKLVIKNSSKLTTKEEINNIKLYIKKTLLSKGIKTDGLDPNILAIKIETTDINKTNIANIQFIIAEEIITKRKDDIETFAYTYFSNDFFEIEEKSDIKESIETLLEQFLELYEEDME